MVRQICQHVSLIFSVDAWHNVLLLGWPMLSNLQKWFFSLSTQNLFHLEPPLTVYMYVHFTRRYVWHEIITFIYLRAIRSSENITSMMFEINTEKKKEGNDRNSFEWTTEFYWSKKNVLLKPSNQSCCDKGRC